jgi:GDP-L-fucose synthase
MKSESKIYIAGHKGMVGSAIEKKLREQGFNNLVLRSRKELDLMDQKTVEDFFAKEKPEYVFFAAAKVGGIQANMKQPFEFLYNNLLIQNNVIHAAYKNDVKKFCFIGSSCIYPKESPQPIKEEYLMHGPLEPTNEGYALAKIAGIKLVQALNKEFGFNAICPMPCNLYGPNDSFDLQHSHVLSALVRRHVDAIDADQSDLEVWGTGVARREFMHVYDVAEAVIFLMLNYNSPEVINVGSGYDLSIKELVEKIGQLTGFKGTVKWDTTKPNGMLRKCLDVSKMTAMGYSPKISIDEGIKEMIDNYKKIKSTVI